MQIRKVLNLRMLDWLVYAIVLVALIWIVAPQAIPVMINKLALATLGGIVAYRLDRSLFPYARPDELIEQISLDHDWTQAEAIVFSMAMIRRAIIVAAVVLAVSLGL